ncbi:A disintegrin and metalloproteinase with thrombospondin motifs 2-like [Ixodes scapularis]|uniref:A disintegrin and metalloproteinase with thrombospondin motifs 2-like n=1 Tax=Ixodes scapularis TaxID=6945 RepID=UPI001C38FAD8|nr:A disintegrin and metalloproteinase with thrombospondin motifs 2-like [Ixodes scapularis]
MSVLLAFLLIFAMLVEGLRSGPAPEYVVYPRLLEARGINGEKILQISEQLSLRLEKSSAIAEKLVVSSLNGAEQVETIVDGKEVEKNIYHDKNQMAAVSLSEQNGTVQVTGALGRTLRIAPLPLMGRCEAGCGAHRIFEIEEAEEYKNDFIAPAERNAFGRRPIYPSTQIPSVFFVEVAMVFDQHHRKQFKTKESLLQYAGLTVQLINMRYDVTSDPKVQFVLVAVLEISGIKTVVAQDYAKPPGYNKRYVLLRPALLKLAWKVNTARIKFPGDLVTLVTSRDIASLDENGVLSSVVLGAAYIGQLCRFLRVAATEDMPHTFSMVSILTHEWGHLLGMVHDGDKPGYYTPAYKNLVCNPKDGYIMAPRANGARNGQWSECSLDQLKGFVRTLDQACLDVRSQTRYNINMTELPGAKITKEQLCRDSFPDFGPLIYVPDENISIRVRTPVTKVCVNLSCPQKDRKPSECYTWCCSERFGTCMEVVLVDGMQCKDGHHCLKQKCVKK